MGVICLQLINIIVDAQNQSKHILTETLCKKKMTCCDCIDESLEEPLVDL